MRNPCSRLGALVAAVSIATVGVVAGPVAAANGGNSANAKLCHKGGWQTLVTAEGESFVDQGACVSYAAQGGQFGEPEPPEPSCLAGGFDARLTGPIDTSSNFTYYESTDGSCSGDVRDTETVASAPDQAAANAKCVQVIGPGSIANVHLVDVYPDIPTDWWLCTD